MDESVDGQLEVLRERLGERAPAVRGGAGDRDVGSAREHGQLDQSPRYQPHARAVPGLRGESSTMTHFCFEPLRGGEELRSARAGLLRAKRTTGERGLTTGRAR